MADDQITAAAREALTKVPPFLLRGVDPSKLKVVVTPNNKQGYHSDAIASVDVGDPNTIQIHDAKAFLQPGAAVQTIAHELTHVQQNRIHPSVSFQPINAADPYGYDANKIGSDATKYSPEQLGAMVQQYTRIQNAPNLNAQQKAQLAAPYKPVLDHFASLPQTTITLTDPSQAGINTQPLPPSAIGNLPLDANQVAPATVDPSEGDWEDLPQKGSGIQTSDSDWEDVPTATEQFNHTAAQRGIGVAKSLGDALAYSNPLTGGIRQMGGMKFLDAQNTDQTIGKVTGDVMQAFIGAPETDVAQGVKSLTQAGKARMGTLLDSNISSALHSDLGTTLSKVAQEAGVEVEPTNDVRKVVGNVANAIREKAQAKLDEVDELFKGLSDDEAPAGLEHYSDIQNAITKKEKDLNMLRSSTPAKPSPTTATSDAMSAAQKVEQKAAALRSEIQALKGQKATADAALDAQGLQGARQQADQLFEQADALDKLRKAHAKSTFGGPGSGQTNPVKFHEQLGDLHDSGELHAALGEHNAQDLMDATGRASRLMDRNAKIRKYGAIGAGAAGLGKLVSGAAHVSELIP